MGRHYILVGHDVVPCIDLQTWAEQFEYENRRVAETFVNDVRVSTVFLGLDHGFGGRPLLFETMIFGGPHDEFCERCSTWDEAVQQHDRVLAMVTDRNNVRTITPVNNTKKVTRAKD